MSEKLNKKIKNFPNILKYSGYEAKNLNKMLRKKNPANLEIKKQEEKLNIELDKLIGAKNEYVYAHDTLTNYDYEVLSKWYKKRIGKIIKFPNFLSSSTNEWKGYSVIYRIKLSKDSRGKDISFIVNKKGESEILFKSNTSFKITGITKYIELSETESSDCEIVLSDNIFINDTDLRNLNKEDSDSKSNLSLSDLNII